MPKTKSLEQEYYLYRYYCRQYPLANQDGKKIIQSHLRRQRARIQLQLEQQDANFLVDGSDNSLAISKSILQEGKY
jgi:hypothetical protein